MKGLENASENSEMRTAEDINNEIKEYETKLEDARKDGDTDSMVFYGEKVSSLRNDLTNAKSEALKEEMTERHENTKVAIGISREVPTYGITPASCEARLEKAIKEGDAEDIKDSIKSLEVAKETEEFNKSRGVIWVDKK